MGNYFAKVVERENSRRKWGEFGMGGFDKVVISSL